MPEAFDTWLEGAPVIVVALDGLLGTWLDGAPVADQAHIYDYIAAPIALAFDCSGTLKGTGTLASPITLALDCSGTLAGAGAMAATVPLAFTLTPAGVAYGFIAGTVALALDVAPTLTGSGALESAIALAWTVTGVMNGVALPMEFSVSGELLGTGYMLASIELALLVRRVATAPDITDTPLLLDSAADRASILVVTSTPAMTRAPTSDRAATLRAPSGYADIAASIATHL